MNINVDHRSLGIMQDGVLISHAVNVEKLSEKKIGRWSSKQSWWTVCYPSVQRSWELYPLSVLFRENTVKMQLIMIFHNTECVKCRPMWVHANEHYLLLKITLVSVDFLSVESAELIRRIISQYPHCRNISKLEVQVFIGAIHQQNIPQNVIWKYDKYYNNLHFSTLK